MPLFATMSFLYAITYSTIAYLIPAYETYKVCTAGAWVFAINNSFRMRRWLLITSIDCSILT